MKKQFLCMATAMMAVSAMSATSVFAAENPDPVTGDYKTDVTYDNRGIATEGDPTNAEWGVAVPSKVLFTEDNKVSDVSVELVGYNGYTLDDIKAVETAQSKTFNAEVTVISKNSLNLVLEGADKDETAYKLNYEANDLTKDITSTKNYDKTDGAKIANLTTTVVTQEGKATLIGSSQKLGEHKDTLTFSVEGTYK